MTDTPAPTPDPWWKHQENWTAIMTVGTLILTVCGYKLTAQDQQTLVLSGGSVAIGTIQILGVLRRALASRGS